MSAVPAQHHLPRILLVEDAEVAAAARHLGEQYEVLGVRDDAHAWVRLNQDTDIEIVITDVGTPRVNGHELLAKIRASSRPQIRNLPVIVMASTDADRARAFNNGASDFLGKPLNPLELQVRVRVHHELARTARELAATRRLLEEQATTDPLTRLKNRRAFAEIGRRHFALARRHRHDLSLVMLDLDHFKEVNDTYGHPAGDRVLVEVAQILAGSVRSGDTPARLGGEEFGILLPNTSQAGAALLAERIRLALAQRQWSMPDRQVVVTASAGVACYSADHPQSLEQLIEIADQRLYRAKQAGRNRVAIN